MGPTGCGKTALVETVTRDCGMVLRTLVGPELSSPLPGEAEKALTTLFDECRLLAQECPGKWGAREHLRNSPVSFLRI